MSAADVQPSTLEQSLRAWIIASRPKTLSAGVVPVCVGSAVAFHQGVFALGPALGALFGALLLQIGSNLANDLFDHEKGADTEQRLGPRRAVQAGLLSPRQVRAGMGVVFGLALLVGVYLTSVAGLWIVGVGLASIAAAILYTAGPYPLGYHGLGELFVLLFFGLVAVCGSAALQTGTLPELAVWSSLPVGCLSSAILVVNNVRDRETDALVNKRTLAVRFGRRAGQYEYLALLLVAYMVPLLLLGLGKLGPWALLPLASLPLALGLTRRVFSDAGALLNHTLVGTAKLLLVFGMLLTLALVLDAGTAP